MQIKYPDNSSLFQNKDGTECCLVARYRIREKKNGQGGKETAEESENIFVTTEIKHVRKTLSNYKCVHLL